MFCNPTFLPPNAFKAALANGLPQVGIWSSLCSNIAAEILACSGFDWILIDTEHAPNEVPGVLSQLQAMAAGTAEPVVRCAWNDTVMMKRILDIGARSILVPFVQNAQEAQAAVSATRYPPFGNRGVSVAQRANRYGRVADYHRKAHENICVLVQVRRGRRSARSRPSPPSKAWMGFLSAQAIWRRTWGTSLIHVILKSRP